MSSNEDSDIECLVPSKSRVRYELEYKKFEDWCSKKNVESVSEKVMLAYFSEKAACEKPSSLWTHYSMVRSTLFLKKKVDISKYMQLHAFLKRKGEGYQAKKSSIFSKEDIRRFLLEADDKRYLMMKVALIIGIFGACRREELKNLTLRDIDDRKSFITITLSKTKAKVLRQFVITEGNISGYNCLENVRKYFHLRPPITTHDRFFVYYKDGKCTSQPVGINTFGAIPKLIATHLGLTNPGSYTGHCFRRSSASLLGDAGADIQTLKRHGRWKSSSVAEGSHEKRIVTGAQQIRTLQEYEDRSTNLYEDQIYEEVLEVESKPLWEVASITLAHTQEDDFENRITGEVQSSGMAPQTPEFRLPETLTLQRVARKSDSIRITGDVQSSGMAPQTSEFRPPETLPMLRLARTLDSIRQDSTSEPGPSSQNPSVTVVCAPELSTMKSSSRPPETSEDPLALLSDPTYEPNAVRPRRFQNASKSVSLTLGPKPVSTRSEVTIEYFGGDSETNVNVTKEYEEQQQDGRNIEKVLLQLRAEKLLLEMEKLKQERLKMEAEKRNIKLRNEILSLRIHLAKPQDPISSSDHPTATRVMQESSSDLTTPVPLQREPSQNRASCATTKQVPLQEESLGTSCGPASNIKRFQCQNSSPAQCTTYQHAAHPTTGAEERTSKKSNERRQLSSERVKEDNHKASSMPVKTPGEELPRKTRSDCSKSEPVSLSAPCMKEEGEEHFTTEQALFYSAVHGELLTGSLDRSGLSDCGVHESDSILEVGSKDLGCGREETQGGGGFPISKGDSHVRQSDTVRKKSDGTSQHTSPITGIREKGVGKVGSSHLPDVYSRKSESKRLFGSAESCALDEEGAVAKKKRVENIERLQSSGVE